MSRNGITSGILATLWCLEDARYARSPSYSNSFVMGEIHNFFSVEIRTFEKGSRCVITRWVPINGINFSCSLTFTAVA